MLELASEEFNQRVCKKFKTNLKQVKNDVEVLKKWIRQQPHLPQDIDETLLTTFLIACKNRMERAKEKIDNYYTLRVVMADYFNNRDPENERMLSHSQAVRYFLLPKLTPDGYRVHWNVYVSSDPDKLDIPTYFKRIANSEDLRYHTESYCLGDYIVFDGKNLNINQVFRFTPTLARDYMYCLQDAFPIIVKGVFIFNAPPFIQVVLNVVKPFMKQKIAKRIHVFKEGVEALEPYIPRKMFPKEYGGEEDTSEQLQERWNKLFREKRDWMISQGNLTVDETKRVGDAKKTRELNDMQGSFKTLCVD